MDLKNDLPRDIYGNAKLPIITSSRQAKGLPSAFTRPTDSRLNPDERFFGAVAADHLQRSDHGSASLQIPNWVEPAKAISILRVEQDRPSESSGTSDGLLNELRFGAPALRRLARW